MARSSVLFLLVVLALSSAAQDRYMVFFEDKANSPYSLQSPLEFLSQRALDRRAKEGYTVNEQDLPVNPAYVQALRAIEGVDVFFTSRWMNGALVQMHATSEQAVLDLAFVKSIEFVAPNAALSYTKLPVTIAETFTLPTATTLTTNTQISMLGADQLHADGFTGEGILMAIFDGGFVGVNLRAPFAHLHTFSRIVGVYDYVRNSGNPYQYHDHGTRVLSCIAGKYEASFTGTSPDIDIVLAVTEEVFKPNTEIDSEYRIEEYNWLFAAEMADSTGVDIINSSLGYSHSHNDPSMDYTYAQMDGKTAVITKAANYAAARGILIVTSAGNDGNKSWTYISAPADSPQVLSVGAVTATGVKAAFSSLGPTADGRTKPDVAAMGSGTVLESSTGNITTSSGTSFSAPLIAGFAASVWQAFPELTRTELMRVMKESGTLASNPDNSLGWGIPNYVVILEQRPVGTDEEKFHFTTYPNPASRSLTIKRNEQTTITFKLMNVKGQTVKSGEMGASDEVLSLEDVSMGIYFLHLQSGNFSETVKLLKK